MEKERMRRKIALSIFPTIGPIIVVDKNVPLKLVDNEKE